MSEPIDAEAEQVPSDGGGRSRTRPIRVGAVVAVALAAGLVIWAVVGSRGGGSSSAKSGDAPSIAAVSHAGLMTLAGALAHPVYWVGERPDMRYEVQQTDDGRIYIRYLPADVEAGDSQARLTVGTYPMADAFAATTAVSGQEDSIKIPAGSDAVAFSSEANPTSAYVAFKGSDYQVEVYDPTPGVARKLVADRAVTRVPVGRADQASAVSPQELARLSTELAQPIYWAGRRAGTTYELTQSADGKLYVRYVPKGVAVGDSRPLPTIATYPVVGAFDQTKAIADDPDSELIVLDGGGVAAFRKGAATNGYVAFPGVDYQIEVFDPMPGAARSLVESGRIVPVR